MKLRKIKTYYHLIRELPDTVSKLESLEHSVASRLFGNNPANDNFYLRFENTFRGKESEIRERQSYYLQFFEQAKRDKQRVIDIGCGRGEFLSLLKDNDISATGIDLNKSMVAHARKIGLDAVVEDANTYLERQPKQTIAAICGFHIAEHIPFSELLVLIQTCYSVLSKDGLLILETPNPESLLTATHNFWLDPSHLNPIPPATLQFALQAAGFKDVTIHRLHAMKENPDVADLSEDLRTIVERYYGPRDYAVVGRKPDSDNTPIQQRQ